jgi:UDP-N-acetylglucosamine:LPS N-acetylglucosamine transferase
MTEPKAKKYYYEELGKHGVPKGPMRIARAVALLKRVRSLIAKEKNWLQGENVNSETNPTRFCVEGGARYLSNAKQTISDALELFENQIRYNTNRNEDGDLMMAAHEYNDKYTHRTVIRHLDRTVVAYGG